MYQHNSRLHNADFLFFSGSLTLTATMSLHMVSEGSYVFAGPQSHLGISITKRLTRRLLTQTAGSKLVILPIVMKQRTNGTL